MPNIENVHIDHATKAESKTKWQKKTVGTSSAGVAITYNNLTIGKTYRFSLQAEVGGSGIYIRTYTVTCGTTLKTMFAASESQGYSDSNSCDDTFVATATTLTVSITNNSGSVSSSLSMILEELPNHEVTTQWN